MNKPKEKILVLKGGFSDENTISLKTAKNVESAIKDLGYDFDSIDCKDNFMDKISNSDFDLCFNALHGEFGEDGGYGEYCEYGDYGEYGEYYEYGEYGACDGYGG